MMSFAEIRHRLWHGTVDHLDPPLLMITLAIMGVGLATVFSATYDSQNRLMSQFINMAVALTLMWGVAQLPPQKLMRFAVPLYVIGLILLVMVFLFGIKVNGARRWLNIGITRIQPSEIMKLAVPMTMAWFFAEKPLPPRLPHLLAGALITAIPFVLIAKQPDLGTALVVGCAGGVALFLAGLSWVIMLGLAALLAAVIPLFWTFVMHDYQRQRVLTFLDPESDPLGTGYHIIQSKIAIGSGGIYGKGWLNGTQSHLDFLPEGSTDFIFAAFSEEFGLVGGCLLLTLYFFIIARCLYMATRAPDTYGRLLAGSLTVIFFVYAFVNSGMVSGLLPVVGLPLPLFSYGGTSLVTIMAGFGMLMSVYSHRRTPSR